MDILVFVVLLSIVGLLARRFGYDSREAPQSKEAELAQLGISFSDPASVPGQCHAAAPPSTQVESPDAWGFGEAARDKDGHRMVPIGVAKTTDVGYAINQRIRKRVEEIFGWMKTVGGFRRTRYLGLNKTQLAGYLVATAYNLVWLVRLVASAMPA